MKEDRFRGLLARWNSHRRYISRRELEDAVSLGPNYVARHIRESILRLRYRGSKVDKVFGLEILLGYAWCVIPVHQFNSMLRFQCSCSDERSPYRSAAREELSALTQFSLPNMHWNEPEASDLLTVLSACLFDVDPVENNDLVDSDSQSQPTAALIRALLNEVENNYSSGPVCSGCRISRWLNCQPMHRVVDSRKESALHKKAEDDMDWLLLVLCLGYGHIFR